MAVVPNRAKPNARTGDAEVLALASGLVMALGKTFNRSDLETLRDVVDSCPDLGRDGAGQVVASFVGLLNDLLDAGQLDKEALAVHVRAWRFMVSRKPGQNEGAQILEGLRRVRNLYDDKAA